MQKVLYKISLFILSGLLIYNSLGYFLVFSAMRIAVRQQKWAELSNIPDNQLTTFVFAKNSSDSRLQRVNNHEIIVDGRLYDIVRKTETSSTVTYLCLYDQKEETLIANTRLLNSQAQQSPFQQKARLIVEKIITTGIIDNNADIQPDSQAVCFSNCIKTFYTGPAMQIAFPPPQSS